MAWDGAQVNLGKVFPEMLHLPAEGRFPSGRLSSNNIEPLPLGGLSDCAHRYIPDADLSCRLLLHSQDQIWPRHLENAVPQNVAE